MRETESAGPVFALKWGLGGCFLLRPWRPSARTDGPFGETHSRAAESPPRDRGRVLGSWEEADDADFSAGQGDGVPALPCTQRVGAGRPPAAARAG